MAPTVTSESLTSPSLGTPNLGTAASEERERIAFGPLRRARRERVLEAMDRLGLDALVLGREGNVRYASGVRRLWTAQSRPFTPTCLVMRATDQIVLLSFSASYEGMPEEVLPDDFFSVTWNPMNFVERFVATEGASSARRVGVDGMSPFFDGLMRTAFPNAALVGAEPMMRDLRRHKLAAEIECIRTAAAIAEASLYAAAAEVRPGVSEKHLQATYLARMCELGTSQFAQQGTFTQVGDGGRVRWVTGDGVLDEGALVVLAGGALWAGYEGSLARTWWSGHQLRPTREAIALHDGWRRILDAVVGACRPGGCGADLRAAFDGAGGQPGDGTIAYSLGLGHEGPVAGGALDGAMEQAERIEAGMVLGVRAVVRGGGGAFVGEEMVLVTESGAEPLTTLGHGPLVSR